MCGEATCDCSTPVRVTILNVDPGGCRLSSPMPATARICPVEGCDRDDPAELAAERRHRRTLQRRGDRAADGRRGMGRGVCEHALGLSGPRAPCEQHASGGSAQAPVERQLEAADPDDGAARHSFGFELLAARGGNRPDRAEHGARLFPQRGAALQGGRLSGARAFGGSAEDVFGGGPFGAFGQHAAVARQQRRAAGQGGATAEQLTGHQPGEGERARPGHACALRRLKRSSARSRATACRTGGCARERAPRRGRPAPRAGSPPPAAPVAVAVLRSLW